MGKSVRFVLLSSATLLILAGAAQASPEKQPDITVSSDAGNQPDLRRCDVEPGTAALPLEALDKTLRPVIDACARIIANPGHGGDAQQALGQRGMAYYLLGKFELAVADYSAALKGASQKDRAAVGLLIDRGSSYLRLGDWDHAIADFTDALQRDPRNRGADRILVSLGTAYFGKGDQDRALESFSRSLKLNPGSVNAAANRAAIYLNRGDDDLALADLNDVLRQHPDRGDALINRGAILARMGRADDAIADLTAGIERLPSNAMGWLARGYARAAKDL